LDVFFTSEKLLGNFVLPGIFLLRRTLGDFVTADKLFHADSQKALPWLKTRRLNNQSDSYFGLWTREINNKYLSRLCHGSAS